MWIFFFISIFFFSPLPPSFRTRTLLTTQISHQISQHWAEHLPLASSLNSARCFISRWLVSSADHTDWATFCSYLDLLCVCALEQIVHQGEKNPAVLWDTWSRYELRTGIVWLTDHTSLDLSPEGVICNERLVTLAASIPRRTFQSVYPACLLYNLLFKLLL